MKLKEKIEKALSETEKELGWMYDTNHIQVLNNFGDCNPKGKINYVVWSDVVICPNCGKEIIYWNETVNLELGEMKKSFSCPVCHLVLKKTRAERAKNIVHDFDIEKNVIMSKMVPVLINYTFQGKRYTKSPDEDDLALIDKINSMRINHWYPINPLPDGYNTEQPKRSNGIYYIHQLYTRRNLIYLATFFSKLKSNKEKFIFTSVLQNATKMYKFRTDGKGGIVSGTLYIPALNQENNVYNLLRNKADMIYKACVQFPDENTIVSTNSSTQELLPDSSVDYIFTDPPFGANINYSELSFLWESWLKVFTNNQKEAICNQVQNKGLMEYQQLMTECFKEFYRILKPNHWMTVEFHNSQNAVWNAIQESLNRAGFIIADVRTLDKKQGSFKQVTTLSAVKQDLIISAYKPKNKFTKDFYFLAGQSESAWIFVQQHLSNLPVVVVKKGKIEVIAERQAYLLFDRMVAYHIIQGIPVPLDATDFYRGLDEKFIQRDGMYFLPDQVNEYDTARIQNDVEDVEMSLFVTNEKSARAWLYQQVDESTGQRQTYAELQPKFMLEVKTVDKYESIPELQVLLEENFLQDPDGKWYVPDRTKEGDIAKLREKNLWKEFEGYMNSKGKLKSFRSEAIRVGFSRLWKEKNYQAIVNIAERLPEKVVQEDDKILMYYDISLSRV